MNARATEAGPQVSASIQLDAALTAIAKRDVNIRAFVRLAPDARDVAAGLDAASTRGPLQGWPIAIKDIIATRNLGTEYGSAIYEGHVPDVDADCVRRLKEAGAVIIGKTATTEFAQLHPAATRNPRDLSRTPGGSSSGSAAAVAAGMARAALGSQTGGSVIRPASYCGVFGFKSSIGRTDTRGVHELARSFDTVGWFARDAADLSTLGQVLLVDSRSPETQRAPRIVRLRTPFDARADSYMHALCDDVAARLGSAGASLVEMPAPASWALLEALHQRIVSVEASRAFAGYDGRLSPILTAFVATGRENEATYAAALAEARRRAADRRRAGGHAADRAHLHRRLLPRRRRVRGGGRGGAGRAGGQRARRGARDPGRDRRRPTARGQRVLSRRRRPQAAAAPGRHPAGADRRRRARPAWWAPSSPCRSPRSPARCSTTRASAASHARSQPSSLRRSPSVAFT